jgi:hypothetical protein
MTYLKWWIAGALCEVLAFIVALPAMPLLGLMKVIRLGSDRAEIGRELAAAEARTRRDRKQLRGRLK